VEEEVAAVVVDWPARSLARAGPAREVARTGAGGRQSDRGYAADQHPVHLSLRAADKLQIAGKLSRYAYLNV
jgi:hypothetical protein